MNGYSDNGGNAESGPKGKLNGAIPGDANSDVFCGKSWATLSNTPFRNYKHYNHEGGIASPLIVHWPAKNLAQGELRHQPCHLIDIMATVVDVTGATYPTEHQGHAIVPAEGLSLLPAFENQPLAERPLFWEHEGNAAVREGDWKLVREGRNGPWELYDLANDRTEMQNLAAAHPKRVKTLATLWKNWAVRAHVLEK